jgi:hypothetical protein
MDNFKDYQTFAAYLRDKKWIAEDAFSSIEASLAAFENSQRQRGAEAARQAMDKAARKAW